MVKNGAQIPILVFARFVPLISFYKNDGGRYALNCVFVQKMDGRHTDMGKKKRE